MKTTTANPRVLILEDDTVFHHWLEEAIGNDYELSFAKTTIEADELIASNTVFDVILVDEHLENERGSEWIKQHAEKDDHPISFVLYSGTESEESLVKSLACGASDFLVKPMPPTVLKMRIEKLLQYQEHTKKYKNEIANQHDLIDRSQNQAHQHSLYIAINKKLGSCKTAAEVEQVALEFLNKLSLHGCFSIHEPDDEGETSYKNSAHGVCSPIEMQVMDLLKGKEAIHIIENRQYFYHPAASLMIYNLPKDGPLEFIAAVVESIGFTLKSLNYQNALLEVQDLIEQSVSDMHALISSAKTLDTDAVDGIASEIGTSFHTLDLTDEKQEFLRYMINKTLMKHSLDNDKYNALTNTFEKTVACAHKALEE